MTPEQINRAVAMELGWASHWECPNCGQVAANDVDYEERHAVMGCGNMVRWVEFPDFCTDHNAAAELRQFVMQQPCIDKYITALADVMLVDHYSLSRAEVWAVMNATPREQAEAFLRMRGKWVEEKI